MSYKSRVDYVGNGTTQQFAIPFPYINQADVYLYQNGVLDTTTAVTWVNSSTVSLSPAPLPNYAVELRRQTVGTENLALFQLGQLAPADLNLDTLQLLYLIQEAEDQEVADFTSASGLISAAQALLAQLQGMSATTSGSVVAATMANLRALPLATITAAVRVELLGYYAAGDGGGGSFIWNATDSRSDDNGVIIKPTAETGNGRLNRNFTGPLHTLWYGIKGDNSTDNSTLLQGIFNQAAALNVWDVYIDPCPDSYINFSTQIVLPTSAASGPPTQLSPFLLIRGAGMGVSNLQFTGGSSTFAFWINQPNGANIIRAPQMFDFSFAGYNFVHYNDPNGSFLDGSSSQNSMQNPVFERVGVYSINPNTAGTYGFQISKCTEVIIQDCEITGFGTHIDLEGCENSRVRDNRCVGAVSQFFLFNYHQTFGNGLIVDGNFLAQMVTGGNAFIVSSQRTITISNNWLEAAGIYTAIIWLKQSQSAMAVIENNWGSFGANYASCYLKVDDTTNGLGGGVGTGYVAISCQNNATGGLTGTNGTANFNSNTGIAYFSGPGLQQRKITHSSSVGQNAEVGFPMNSRDGSLDSIMFQPLICAYFSPNDDGLNTDGYGPQVMCIEGAFAFGATGSGNYLDFSNTDKTRPKGTLKLYVLASSASGSNIHGAVTDAGAVAGSFATQALTPTPQWYLMNAGQSVTTGGGCQFYADNTDVRLYAAALSQ